LTRWPLTIIDFNLGCAHFFKRYSIKRALHTSAKNSYRYLNPKFRRRENDQRNRIIEIELEGRKIREKCKYEQQSNRKRGREIHSCRPYRRRELVVGRFVWDKPSPFAISNLVVDDVQKVSKRHFTIRLTSASWTDLE